MSTYDSKRPVQFVLFVSFALLLLVNSAVAIRSLSAAAGASDRLAKSEPAGNRESGGERTLGGEEAESTEASTAGMDDFNEQCNDADDEECLIRRILAAHVDYIYTQHHKP